MNYKVTIENSAEAKLEGGTTDESALLKKKLVTVNEEIAKYDAEVSKYEEAVRVARNKMKGLDEEIEDARAASTKADNAQPNFSSCNHMINGWERRNCINTQKQATEEAKRKAKEALQNLLNEKKSLATILAEAESNLKTAKANKVSQESLLTSYEDQVKILEALDSDIFADDEVFDDDEEEKDFSSDDSDVVVDIDPVEEIGRTCDEDEFEN